MFEIFIRPLELPSALRFRTIGELKTTLASIIVLTLAVTFLTMVQEPIEDAMSILLKGLAIAAVILALVFFARNGEKEEH